MGLAQDQAATKCNVSREMWGRYERGLAKPGAEVLVAMGQAGFDVAYILTGESAALRSALHDVRIATHAASMIAGTQEERASHQVAVFDGLKGSRKEEAQLLSDYRRCKPPEQKVIRKMAASLAEDGPAESKPKKSIRKKGRS